MKRARRLVVLTLAALAATPATRPDVAGLVEGLNAAEPATRRQAFDALTAVGDDAVPALRQALRDARPAVAEAAAEIMLARLNRPWTDRRDPPAVRLMLNGANYALRPAEDRSDVLNGLRVPRRTGVDEPPLLPGASATIVRVLTQDPADEVGWNLVWRIDLATDGVDAGTAADPKVRPPALDVLLAKAAVRNADPAALPLVKDALARDLENPAATFAQKSMAVAVLGNAEMQSGNPSAATAAFRDLLATPASEDDAIARANLVTLLMGLHACAGPLPGVADDVAAVGPASDATVHLSAAEAARRSGMPVVATMLFDAAVARPAAEGEPEYAARLTHAAEVTIAQGSDVLACRVLEKIDDLPPDSGTSTRFPAARRSLLHERAGRFGYAAEALQKAVNRPEETLLRRGDREPFWPADDAQARAYLDCLLDARTRGDAGAARRHAEQLAGVDCDDADVIVAALPFVSDALGSGAADAYFERAYERAKAKISEEATEPAWRNGLAWLCARSGRRLPEAVAVAEQAVAMNPTEASFLDTLAEAVFRVGRVKDAIELERRALAAGNEDEWFIRGQIERFETARPTR